MTCFCSIISAVSIIHLCTIHPHEVIFPQKNHPVILREAKASPPEGAGTRALASAKDGCCMELRSTSFPGAHYTAYYRGILSFRSVSN